MYIQLVVQLFTALSSLSYAFGLSTVPSVYSTSPGHGNFFIQDITAISYDFQYKDSVDHTGQTLIPPILEAFATLFADDFSKTFEQNVSASGITDATNLVNSVYLTLTLKGDYRDAAGRWTSEGYTLNVSSAGVTVSGGSPLGVWWGTRTLLQLAALGNGFIPAGIIHDAPGWAERGVMLDAARHYYPPEFIIEMCAYLSFFKQNLFHLHLSDDATWDATPLEWNDSRILDKANAYAAFRLNSDASTLDGLNTRFNESYTRDIFEDIQCKCAARGVTIVPEIESPGHALVLNQWKPWIARTDNYDLLNISAPDTIPTVKTIWSEVLPWVHSKTVHIGADEYDTSLPDDYNFFVNSMNEYIGGQGNGGKQIRIWNTFPPNSSYAQNIATNVSIQWWDQGYGDAYNDYIKNNYTVVNSYDAFYIVNKINDGFPQHLNATSIFQGNPETGGSFSPNIFDLSDASNNAPRDEPLISGCIVPLWNDYGPIASVYSEAYYAWRDLLPAMADKQWGGNMTQEQYENVFDILHAVIPGQNLDRFVPSKTSTIVQYNFEDGTATDTSGNGYHGHNHGCIIKNSSAIFDGSCYLNTPLDSKGRDYRLTFSINPSSNVPASLFQGSWTELRSGNGTVSNVTMLAGGNSYFLNYSLPTNTWTTLSLLGMGNATFLQVNDEPQQEFYGLVGVDGFQEIWLNMAFEAPLMTIGYGFRGMMRNISLSTNV